jgi:hypothetical protein
MVRVRMLRVTNLGSVTFSIPGSQAAGVNGFYVPLDPQGDINAVSAVREAGGKLKVILLPTGYGDTDGILTSPAATSAGFNVGAGYVSGDVLVTGLELAGKSPAQESFMTRLRADKNYTGNGLLPRPVSFSTPVSKGGLPGLSSSGCLYFLQAVGGQYKVVTPKPVCDGYTGQLAAK